MVLQRFWRAQVDLRVLAGENLQRVYNPSQVFTGKYRSCEGWLATTRKSNLFETGSRLYLTTGDQTALFRKDLLPCNYADWKKEFKMDNVTRTWPLRSMQTKNEDFQFVDKFCNFVHCVEGTDLFAKTCQHCCFSVLVFFCGINAEIPIFQFCRVFKWSQAKPLTSMTGCITVPRRNSHRTCHATRRQIRMFFLWCCLHAVWTLPLMIIGPICSRCVVLCIASRVLCELGLGVPQDWKHPRKDGFQTPVHLKKLLTASQIHVAALLLRLGHRDIYLGWGDTSEGCTCGGW